MNKFRNYIPRTFQKMIVRSKKDADGITDLKKDDILEIVKSVSNRNVVYNTRTEEHYYTTSNFLRNSEQFEVVEIIK